MLVEIGEMEEKVDGQLEKVKTVEIDEISYLLKSTSISKDISETLYQCAEGVNTNKHIDTIKVELSTVADDIEDFIDENEIDKNSTRSEVDWKISKIEKL